jgi:hypothetical protein
MIRKLHVVTIAAVSCAAFAQQPIGTMQSQDATVRGAVTIKGPTAELRSGSEIETGTSAANVNLARGGKVRICPRSSVQITSSPDGRALLVALNSGALETDYMIPGGADSIMTPEFQMQLAGPGTFHYAFGTNGNELCARGLAGSNASVIAGETLGAGTYQLRPADNIVFRGSLSNPDASPQAVCGCPEAVVKNQPTELGFPEQQSQTAAKAMAEGSAPPAAPPLPQIPEVVAQNQPVTQISVPLTFRSSTVALPPLPEPYFEAELPKLLSPIAVPKVVPPPKAKKNWIQKFFGKLFG